jgi:hypothetical protein
MIRLSTLLTATITLVAGGAVASFPADVYEAAPYQDSTREGTSNVLSAGQPQQHTLHDAGDVDWGIILETDELQTLVFEELSIPAETILRVQLFDSETDPQVDYALAESDLLQVQWFGQKRPIFFSVSLCSIDSVLGECLPVEIPGAAASYVVRHEALSADGSLSPIQLIDGSISVPIRLPEGNLSDYLNAPGMIIYRNVTTPQGESTENRLNQDPIPISCVEPCPLGAANCTEYLDKEPPVEDRYSVVSYRAEFVSLSGSTSLLDALGNGGYVPGAQTLSQALCFPAVPTTVPPTTAPPTTTAPPLTTEPPPTASPSPTATLSALQLEIIGALSAAGVVSSAADVNGDAVIDAADVMAAFPD